MFSTISSQTDYYAIAGHLIGSTNGTATTYDLTDAEGSVLTSLSSSAVLGEQIYGPYGNQRYTQGTMGTDKGYTGQFQDAVSGLDYYNTRYYDPVMGQFLSADSVQGNAQGFDPYSYVNGNPETATDPTGNRISCPPDCGGSTGAPCTYGDAGCKGDCGDACGGGGGNTGSTNITLSYQEPTPTAPASTPTSTSNKGKCGNLNTSQCQKGNAAQQKSIQDLKNQQSLIKVVIAGIVFAADLVTLIADIQTASGVAKILEIIGDVVSLLGDGMTILSQIGQLFHWTGAQATIDFLGGIASTLGAIYKGIRGAMASPWGLAAETALIVGFYSIRSSLFGGDAVSLAYPILDVLVTHYLKTKDNPGKFLLQGIGSAAQAWWNYDQYRIDVLSNESPAAYCHNNPSDC